MRVQTNGDYNPVQLNETINLSPNGKLLSKSLMLNLRGETTKEVWTNYQELTKLIDGKDKPEKNVKNNPGKGKRQDKKELKKDNSDTCPECGSLLVEKQGISRKNGKPYHFEGCSSFPACTYTRNIPSKDVLSVADEDLMAVFAG